MNLNFIGQEFDRLHKLEDYINYEYEPKSNKRIGKRNIYYEDIKLDFINEVNTYGFSPFILKNFTDQRDDPNIMRFMTKKFNHGLTNYVRLETRAIAHHTSKDIKKYLFRKKHKKQIKKNKSKKKEIYSNIFLVRKNEDKKKNEVKENFLQKALYEVGGNKLNISMEEEEEQVNKEKENEEKNKLGNTKNSNQDELDIIKKNELSENQKEFILKEKELLEKKQDEKNIELLKKYMGINRGKHAIGKNELQHLPNLFNSNDAKKSTLKLVFQNKGYNSKTINLDDLNNKNKKILSLSKNKELLGDKREYIFKRLFSSTNTKSGKKLNINNNQNDNKASNKTENRSFFKKLNGKKQLKDEFLLFAKARPYRYMTTVEN